MSVAEDWGDALDFEAMHLWFGLSYANYLVVPRTLIQSMPDEWQKRLAICLFELDEAARELELAPSYAVQAKGSDGKFMRDPIGHYRRGRTRVPLRLRR